MNTMTSNSIQFGFMRMDGHRDFVFLLAAISRPPFALGVAES